MKADLGPASADGTRRERVHFRGAQRPRLRLPLPRESCPDPERIARGTAQRLIHENGRGTGVFGPYLALFKGVFRGQAGALGLIFSAPPVHPTLAQSHYGRQLVVCLRS